MRKILVSLLVVSMLLGLVGTAAAAGFSDTTNADVLKVYAYGWVGGYDDGTFKPEANITRAEAAKMMVNALGLSAAAEASKGLAPRFSDVAGSHWASGYTNVCVAQGVLTGYTDGTFKPEANITGAEIVTMIVRSLKRESQATGDWPVGHITVAAANDIIGTGFSANALATRAQVAEWLINASAVKVMELTADGWQVTNKTWITDDFATFTGTISAADSDEISVSAVAVELDDNDDEVEVVVTTDYDLASNYVIAGGLNLADVVGRACNITWDTDEVVYIEVDTTITVKTGTVSTVSTDYFYLDDNTTKYEVGDAANKLDIVVYKNGVKLVDKDITTLVGTIAADDEIEFHVDDDDVVTYISFETWQEANIEIKDVSASTSPATITDINNAEYYVPSSAVITLNGATSALADLDDGMYANIAVDPDDNAKITRIDATDKTVEGEVTAVRRSQTGTATYKHYLTVGGVEYRIDVGTDAQNDTALAALNGNTATLYLDLDSWVKDYSTTASSTPFAKIISFETGDEDWDKWTVDLKGVTTTYQIDADTNIGAITVGDYVELGFTTGGKIDITKVTEYTMGTPLYKVISVYTGSDDTIINIDDVADGFADADTAITATSSTVVYDNGTYKALSALEAGEYITYVNNTDSEVAFIGADTDLAYESGYIVSDTAGVVECRADGIEDEATVLFFDNVLRTTERIITVTTGTAVANAGGNIIGVKATTSGTFKVTITGALDTVYVKMTDAYNNSVNATWDVKR